MKFENKIVWIAGASSGIGESLVYTFIKEGATVLASAPFEDELNKVKQNCGEQAGSCHIIPLDMTKSSAFPDLVKEVVRKYEKIDVLFNVAGISQRALAEETKLVTIRKIMEINFFGTVALSREVLLQMKKQGSGKIAAITSISGKFGFPLRSAYAASKHALHGYFESLQAELLNSPIKVSLMVPGRVSTSISKNALKADGTAWGKMDPGLAGGIPVEKATRQMVNAVYKGKREVLIGGKEIWMVHFKRFLPVLFWRIVGNVDPT